MALLSGENVVWVSLLNSLSFYILENNARAVAQLDIYRFILKYSMTLHSGENVVCVSILNRLPYYILENNARAVAALDI